MVSNLTPSEVYDRFVGSIRRCILDSGAIIPSGTSLPIRAKPLWWNAECDRALKSKRENYRRYQANQSLQNRMEFKKRDNDLKMIFRLQKTQAFKDFYNEISPSRGTSTLWRTIRALSSRSNQLYTNIATDSSNPELIKYKDDLIREDLPPINISLAYSISI